jgi:hypothetical protein
VLIREQFRELIIQSINEQFGKSVGEFIAKMIFVFKTTGKTNKKLTNLTTYKIKIMAPVNPHISFNGNAEETFTFYKSVFGGEFAKSIRFKDLASPEFRVAEKEENKIMHIAFAYR